MKASQNCIAVIKHYEKFFSKPYLCPSKVATIGYGTTVYPNGIKVKLTDKAITEPEAVTFLMHDLQHFENDVLSLLKVEISQNMFDALVSFSYNVGSDIDADNLAEGLGDSTLMHYINKDVVRKFPDWKKIITKEMCKWIYGDGKKLAGLVARRSTEALLATDGVVKFFN